MSTKNLHPVASEDENDQIKSLLSALNEEEQKIRIAVAAKVSFVIIVEYEKKYMVITKEINALHAKLGTSNGVKEEYKSETERAGKNFVYREKNNEIETFEEKESISKDSNAFLLESQIQNTPIISRQNKDGIPTLDWEQLKLADSINKPSASSTPHVENTDQFRPVKFDTPKDCFKYIRQEITEEIPSSHVESLLEDKNNYTELLETVARDFQLPYIYQVVKNKVLWFVERKKEELATQTKDDTPLLTALDNLPEDTITEIMSNTLSMRAFFI